MIYREVSCGNSLFGEKWLQCLMCNDWCHKDSSEAKNKVPFACNLCLKYISTKTRSQLQKFSHIKPHESFPISAIKLGLK